MSEHLSSTSNHPGYPMGRGLRCLAVINEWEREHMPFIKSTSGRDLYFLLVKHFVLTDRSWVAIPLKSFTVDLTDKAMRKRMKDFELQGLLAIENSVEDRRSKTIQPTDKMRGLFDAHTLVLRRCFKHYFDYAKKDDAAVLNGTRDLLRPNPGVP